MKKTLQLVARVLLAFAAVAVATAIWLPCMHLFFRPDVTDFRVPAGLSQEVRAMGEHHLQLWADSQSREHEIEKMRQSNAEWDFMGRTFLVVSLANMALRNEERRQEYLDVMDRVIDETIRLEAEHGMYYFLMDYARSGSFVSSQKRSMFEDGEIALMIGARRIVEEKEEYAPLLKERVTAMVSYMQESPVLSGESYPDECWTFCNSVALTAIRISDVLDGTDHSEFIAAWLAMAKEKLVDEKTGILVSSYGFDGTHYDGPEGSSIWLVAHCLQLIDPEFAADQYARARAELGKSLLGFGFGREWPESWVGPADIDSGPIIPIIEISAGSSGLAFVGASSFGDDEFLVQLLTSLKFGGFPVRTREVLRFCASNQVGDAVLLYAMVLGPLWEEVERRAGA
jgi:hypothetical protein